MPELYYRDALKLGQREYRACVASGRYPYLPVLDQILPEKRILMGADVGLVSVPAEFIVGTRTGGRTKAFAGNFMPLLAENSEFAVKWERLCQSHLKEGIRDPIKVYEYLNRYYVEEGNKRVSVLKFFDAVSISAQVIRVMPEPSDAPEVAQYLALLAFQKVSGINYLELNRQGGYERLLTLMRRGADEVWTPDDRAAFSTVYHSFKAVYESAGGGRLNATAGDALLAAMEVYGYDALRGFDAAEMKKAVQKVWEELRLQQEASPVALIGEPADERREGLLTRVLSAPKAIRAAFIYDRSPEDSAWAYGHEQGRQHVQRFFDGRVETRAYCGAMDGDARQIIERAIAEGSRVLFTTSPRLLPESLAAAVEHPEVTFLNCSLNQSHRYIRTYYARIHEAKFIVGAIAGALAGREDVGYVCDYPICEQIAGINSFALGVQLTNPGAKVRLEWSSVDGHRAARRKLAGEGVQLISCQDFSRREGGGFGLNGLARVRGDEAHMLAAPLWRWDVYYEEMLRRILNRTAQEEYAGSVRALNYYWGMSAGVVDVQCAEDLPEGVAKLANILRESLRQGLFSPFAPPVRDQAGREVAREALALEQIVEMNYLVQNVVGEIPAAASLNRGRQTVEIMGVEAAARPGDGEARRT